MQKHPFKKALFFTQTDTTLGFVSQDTTLLNHSKQRLPQKHYIKAVDSLESLKTFIRVPKQHKKRVRRAKKTTFIFPNGDSYRVVEKNHPHQLLLKRFRWLYTTSANQSGKAYDETFATQVASVVITPRHRVQQASKIYKLGTHTIKRIR
jgi:tRNA A37 threonylcarbamoyladenosine synthetase subunit TsaC/SUA5/YrdC